MIRKFIEAALRDVQFRRRLPREFGAASMVVSPSCGLRYCRLDFRKVDPTLFRLAKEYVKPGDVVWDVGANVGLFTFASAAMAGIAGHVVAFEPDTALVAMLRKSCRGQTAQLPPITVMPVACGKAVEPREFHLANRSRSTNHLHGYGSNQTGGTRETQTVMTITLDWAIPFFRPPNILKIDVEGAETEVLSGATRLLQEVRPIIICEVGERSSAAVGSLLHDHGYRLLDADNPADGSDLKNAPWNTLAIPRARAS
jgi:FkbM family methyltransferase